jgi:hypothetical protein
MSINKESKYLPPTGLYIQYLSTVSARFDLSMNECRDKFGLYTIAQWEDLLTQYEPPQHTDNQPIKLNPKTEI